MRSVIITVLIAALAAAGMYLVIENLAQERTALRREHGPGTIIPSAVAKIVTLDFKNIFSDTLFFKGLMFYGGKVLHEETLTNEEWEWFYQSMAVATDLDPYFLDPYYLGAMNLAWQANQVDKANALLEKAMRARTWDWTIPFYLGFNYFYFIKDNEKAAHYLMEAAKRPGGSTGIAPTLAARLAHAGGETESAVVFLEDMLAKTDHEPTRYIYGLRLNTLKRVLYLEKAVEQYRKKFGRRPRHLDELVKQGVIREIPSDPYGGTFYLSPEGDIKTTSTFYVQDR
jgi:tetratricopeptide (TPR) repeat protein